MRYYSTSHRSPLTGFREATLTGIAPDKGLYFPESIPHLPVDFMKKLHTFSREEIACRVILPYVERDIPQAELERIVAQTINFSFPLVAIDDKVSSMELFHGPTLAFKDVGARFMSRCLAYFVQDQDRKITVLVATSGDTGGAVANGFYDADGIDVVILYPSGKVSSIQELQLTTLGKNICAVEVDGSFDDCQNMVKRAFGDNDLAAKLTLTSANSINVARWLPQQFYYFFACQHFEAGHPLLFSVPSGNFGNISAGLLAYRSGLPVEHFIAACNANDVVPAFLATGTYAPKKSITTISNAMDVGDPSNFVRILEMFKNDPDKLRPILSAFSISDANTMAAIKAVYASDSYLLDPHGAVGYVALKNYMAYAKPAQGIILETAHPVKFYDVIEPIIQASVQVPSEVQKLFKNKKESISMNSDFNSLKDFLLSR